MSGENPSSPARRPPPHPLDRRKPGILTMKGLFFRFLFGGLALSFAAGTLVMFAILVSHGFGGWIFFWLILSPFLCLGQAFPQALIAGAALIGVMRFGDIKVWLLAMAVPPASVLAILPYLSEISSAEKPAYAYYCRLALLSQAVAAGLFWAWTKWGWTSWRERVGRPR